MTKAKDKFSALKPSAATAKKKASDQARRKLEGERWEASRYAWLNPAMPVVIMPAPAPAPPTPAPRAPTPPLVRTSSKTWITEDAGRMKAAGDIPAGISKTNFAKILEQRMLKAAETNPSIDPITWRSIQNQLSAWGLWPI
jgi:hypothetical protein